MNNSQTNILELIREKAKAITPKGSKVYLLGSRARGDARQDSDWDILILLDKDKIKLDDIDAYSYPLRELGWDLDENINPILYTEKDWNANSYTPFYKNVVKEGIPLWD